jgi:hypothetical protein
MHALLLFLAITSIGSDAYVTQHDWSQPHAHEVNALARPFVSHGPVLSGGYFALSAAGLYGVDRKLTRHGHKKLAIALDVVTIGMETYWTQYSVRHGKGW